MKRIILIILIFVLLVPGFSQTKTFSKYGDAISDFLLKVAAGMYPGIKVVNKYGRSLDVDSHDTDIWDGAVAGDAGDLWVAPTVSRIHAIVSSSTDDDGDPVGTGARTIIIYGLPDWDTKEVSETIILDGTTPVNTVNEYVIIHRMRVTDAGASGPNVGIIKATAATDLTVTAQISAMEGQTQMAIYGIPSNQYAYMSYYYMSAIKASASLSVEDTLLINYIPNTELIGGWTTKHTVGVATEGNSYVPHNFKLYFQIPGPAIIKMSGNSSAANTDVSAGFSLILVDN